MASPLGHSLASLLLRSAGEPKDWLWQKAHEKWWRTPLAAIVLGSLPDLDLLVSWCISGSAVTYHQHFTHNVWLALVVGLCMALLARRDWWRAGMWGFSLVALHIIIDAGVGPVMGGPETLGVYALWPVSDVRVGLPFAFIPMLHFGTPDQILSWSNACALLHEAILFGLPLAFILWLRR
jgi:membrane-bound metal-dependent hydrolase YbcI (DUF457 family)